MARLLEELTTEEKQNLVDDILRKKNGELKTEWADIVDEYDLDMSGDTLRKAGVGIKLADDAGMVGKSIVPTVWTKTDDSVHTEITSTEICLNDPDNYTGRQMMRDLVRENNKVYRAESRDRLLREAVENAVKLYHEPAEMKAPEKQADGNCQMVVMLGDIHYGEEMDVRGFYGEPINVYNAAICLNRMTELFEQIVLISQREKPNNIQIMMVGDCIAGMLRMSQLQSLQYGIVDQTIRFGNLFANWLTNIDNCTDAHIDVHMVGGNHDEVRPLGSKARDFPGDNIIKIVNWYLKARFDSIKNITVHDLTGRYHMVDVEGYNFLMLHGDGGKIGDICRDAVNVYGHPVDYFVCGHLHHEEEIASGSTKDGHSIIMRVPSICGMDGYAQKLGLFSKPGATIMIMEKGKGRRCVYPIELK